MNLPRYRSSHLPPDGPPELAQALRRHVEALATHVGERHTRAPVNLEVAARYIEKVWVDLGLSPTRQTFRVDGVDCSNLSVVVPGPDRQEILLGAHYDSVEGCPGANDNGSGVAALLELTRLALPYRGRRTLRLVAFVNEEPPYFDSEAMGSRVYAQAARYRGDDIHAMLCLETLGCYDDRLDSQDYPPLFEMVTGEAGPRRGNFITIVGNVASAWLVDEVGQGILEASPFPVESIVSWAGLTGVDWSDHASFWRHDYPAVMLTDTAPYRYQQYHTAEDTADRVHYGCLAELVRALSPVVQSLTQST